MADQYLGHWPSNVARDAKYHVSANGHKIVLVYRETIDEERLLTTREHPKLAELVNRVKVEEGGQPGGSFYINEYAHVVVPVAHEGETRPYFAGLYRESLEFRYHDMIVGSAPPAGLRPGDEWPGPHVGIAYILQAGADDIRYETRDPSDQDPIRKVRLSRVQSASYAARPLGDSRKRKELLVAGSTSTSRGPSSRPSFVAEEHSVSFLDHWTTTRGFPCPWWGTRGDDRPAPCGSRRGAPGV